MTTVKGMAKGSLQALAGPLWRCRMRMVGLAALVTFVGAFRAEAGQPQPRSAEPLLRITGVVTQVEISKWVEEPEMAPSIFFTLHMEAGDVSDAAPYGGKGMAAHCFVSDRATVEGYYPPD
jgi:hypothetical protein